MGIANLVLSDAPILILDDEPFSGLDPIGIKDLKNLIQGFKEKEKPFSQQSYSE